MADNLPPHLIQHGWQAEVTNHRDNLARALDAVERYAAQAKRALDAGTVDTHSLRQIVSDGAEAYQRGAALAAIDRLRFALPDDTPTT